MIKTIFENADEESIIYKVVNENTEGEYFLKIK